MIEATTQGESAVAPPRLGVLATHPIQHQVPLYHALTCRGHVNLEVAFLSDAGLRSYRDPGFGRDVRWDVDLTSGYQFVVLARDGSGVLARLALVFRLAGWIHRQSAVVVYGHRHPGMLLAVLLCRLLRRPYLLRGDAQVEGLGRSSWRRAVRALVARVVVRGSAAALPVGTGNAAFYRHFGQRQLFWAPHSVDDARFAVAPEQSRAEFLSALGLDPTLPVVLFCGKLVPVKRPCDVIEAFRMLTTPASLIVVGEGPLRREVEQGLPERDAALAGFLNQAALPAAYHASDVLVLPSSQESWGLVVNEAMHAGVTPVVSDRVGCASDLVSGVGEVFPWGDVPALAAANDLALQRATRAEARTAAKGWRPPSRWPGGPRVTRPRRPSCRGAGTGTPEMGDGSRAGVRQVVAVSRRVLTHPSNQGCPWRRYFRAVAFQVLSRIWHLVLTAVPPLPIMMRQCSPRPRTLRAATRRPYGPSLTVAALRHGWQLSEERRTLSTARSTDLRDNRVSTRPGTVHSAEVIGDRRLAGVRSDVEGAERLVLLGGWRALREHRIGLIQLEWNNCCAALFGETCEPVRALLESCGYRLFRPTGGAGGGRLEVGDADAFAVASTEEARARWASLVGGE